uniref:ANK_REP_REGION domain-containing protein n=1 Tax=Macrostomum lignano TaxID=282301 RepID=A0A1I8IYI6_9PLAT
MINDTPSTEHPAAAWAGENIEQILDIIYLAKSSADQQEIPADELRKIQERELRPMWLDQTDNPLSNMARNAVAGDNADLDRTLAYLTDQQTSLLLRHCILLGHLALALTLLTRVSDVDWKISSDETALMLAAGAGHHELVTALLHRGASVEAEDSEGWTALSRACRAGQLRVIRLLLLMEDPTRITWTGWAAHVCSWPSSADTSDRCCGCFRNGVLSKMLAPRQPLRMANRLALRLTNGWANSLIQVNGRTGADSDIDWTIIMPQVFHLAGGCHCEELQGNKRLQVVQGHAQVEVGTGNQPAVAAAPAE